MDSNDIENNLRIDLSKQSTKHLKKKCKSFKLSAQGTKKDLINRIIAYKSQINITICKSSNSPNNVLSKPSINLKQKSIVNTAFVPNNFRNVTEYVMEMSHSDDFDKKKAVYYQSVIDKFGKKHQNTKTLQTCYIFCLKYYFENNQFQKAYKCLVKLQHIDHIKGNQQYKMNLIGSLSKHYLKHIGPKIKSTTKNKNKNTFKIKAFLNLLPDNVIIEHGLCLYKAQIICHNNIKKVLKYYDMEQNTKQLITFSEWIINKFSANDKQIHQIKKCYEFCINYYWKMNQYQQAFDHFIVMYDIFTLDEITQVENINTISCKLAQFYSIFDEKILIMCYLRNTNVSNPNKYNTELKYMTKIIALFYGRDESKIEMLFKLLSDYNIQRCKLCSYAATVIYKNDIDKAMKYYNMEPNTDQKFIIAAQIIKQFGNEENDSLIKDCYSICLCEYCDSQRYEQAFDCYLVLISMVGNIKCRYTTKLAKYYSNIKGEALMLGYTHTYYKQQYPTDLINLFLHYYGDTQCKARILFERLNDYDIVQNDLTVYAIQVIYNNNIEKFLTFLKLTSNFQHKMSLYQYFLENFVKNNKKNQEKVQKCYQHFLCSFTKKRRYGEAFECYIEYVQIEDIDSTMHPLPKHIERIAAELARHFSSLKEKKLTFGYIRNCYGEWSNALTNIIISYYASKDFKLQILFQRLSDDLIEEYELYSVASKIVHKNNPKLVLKYYKMELKCLKESNTMYPKCSSFPYGTLQKSDKLNDVYGMELEVCRECRSTDLAKFFCRCQWEFSYGGYHDCLCERCYRKMTTINWKEIGKNKKVPMLYAKIGSLLYQKNNKNKALKYFVRSEKLDGGRYILKYGFEFEYAFCLLSNKQFEKALQYIEIYEKNKHKNKYDSSFINDTKKKLLQEIEKLNSDQNVNK